MLAETLLRIQQEQRTAQVAYRKLYTEQKELIERHDREVNAWLHGREPEGEPEDLADLEDKAAELEPFAEYARGQLRAYSHVLELFELPRLEV